jgi:uncharacterized membrane protein YebE (DUF533 family)
MMMFDIGKLLPEMFGAEGSARKKERFRTRADIQKHLGDDPFASLRAIATAAAESLGPIRQKLSTSTVAPWAAASPEQARAILLLRAMIAAAKADGEVDPEERARIVARLRAAGAEADVQRFVEEELARPVDLYAITSEVRDAATAAEVYAASLAAIRVDTEAERRYLDNLALRLGLDRVAVDEINRRLESSPVGHAP